MNWFLPQAPVVLGSHLESVISLVFAYFAFVQHYPSYTDIDVLYAEWYDRGNL